MHVNDPAGDICQALGNGGAEWAVVYEGAKDIRLRLAGLSPGVRRGLTVCSLCYRTHTHATPPPSRAPVHTLLLSGLATRSLCSSTLLFAHSVPVYPYTLQCASSLAFTGSLCSSP